VDSEANKTSATLTNSKLQHLCDEANSAQENAAKRSRSAANLENFADIGIEDKSVLDEAFQKMLVWSTCVILFFVQ
jgi:hypothetical protein